MEIFFELFGRDGEVLVWWQMINRAVLVFVYAVLLYRLAPKKALGNSAVLDIATTVVIGSALSRALTGNAPILPVFAATAALMLLHILLSILTRRFDGVSRAIKGRPVRLVHNGEVHWPAMRRAQLGERDLMENLRLSGVSDLEEVAEAYLERNGAISVIKTSNPKKSTEAPAKPAGTT